MFGWTEGKGQGDELQKRSNSKDGTSLQEAERMEQAIKNYYESNPAAEKKHGEKKGPPKQTVIVLPTNN